MEKQVRFTWNSTEQSAFASLSRKVSIINAIGGGNARNERGESTAITLF